MSERLKDRADRINQVVSCVAGISVWTEMQPSPRSLTATAISSWVSTWIARRTHMDKMILGKEPGYVRQAMPFGTMTSSDTAEGPPAADPLSAIAPLLRVRPEIQAICRFAERWEAEHQVEPPGWAQFHIVTKGRCFLEQRDGNPLLLQAGQLLLLPHGDAHVVRSADRGDRTRAPIRIEFNNAVRIKTNTKDESDTELICGRLKFHAAPDNLILAALPAAIVLRLGPAEPFHRMRMLVQAMDEELEAGRLGATAVAEDLARALFVMMLRGHFDQAACSSNLMKLLVAPPSARAVTAMLTAPAQPWTLDELAAEARVSRATLVRIFRQAAGLAPLAFLSELRLELARHRLASTKVSLATLAAEVGYESESSFARAFRRRFGVSPGRSRAAGIG